jgi:hypothetical protein
MSKILGEPKEKISVDRHLVEITIPMHLNSVNSANTNIYDVKNQYNKKMKGAKNAEVAEDCCRMVELLEYAAECRANFVETTQISNSLRVRIGFEDESDSSRFSRDVIQRVVEKVKKKKGSL